MAIKITEPMFDELARALVEGKAAEAAATTHRREVEKSLLGLPEVQGCAKPKGTVTMEGQTHRVKAVYVLRDEYDVQGLRDILPSEYMARIFPPKPTFSQSGLNALLRELDGAGVLDEGAAAWADAIRRLLEAHNSPRPGSTQITVTKLED